MEEEEEGPTAILLGFTIGIFNACKEASRAAECSSASEEIDVFSGALRCSVDDFPIICCIAWRDWEEMEE